MCELPNYVAMSPEEFLNNRASGVASMGAPFSSFAQPGIVGMYNRKPIFLYNNQAEQDLLWGGKLEEYFALRGFKNQILTDRNPNLPKITIP